MAELSHTLATPLEDGRGEIKSVTLKTPKARLFRLYGSPMVVKSDRTITADGSERVIAYAEFNDTASLNFIAEMSGVDQVTLDDLSAPDYLAVRSKMMELINKANPTAAPKE